MNHRFRITFRSILPGVVLLFTGCSIQQPHLGSHDHAFIAYWPPQDQAKLRLAVKDLIDVKGAVTTAGSQHLAESNPPAARDARCLALARERGVQIVGKTNLSEFGLGVTGVNKYFGTPKNPLARSRIPGGSSSGSAVAVANGLADVALGTDTAGSIRIPAACTGVAGLKTTHGLVPLAGVFPLSPRHLDTVGPMAKDVDYLVRGMGLLQRGFASRYRGAVAARPSAGQIRIARFYVEGTDPAIDAAVDAALAATGFRVVTLDRSFLAKWQQAQQHARTVALADSWRNTREFVAKNGVSLETKATIALGRLEADAEYQLALNQRNEWKAALRDVFRKVDFIALPTLQSTPPRKPLFIRSALFESRVLALQNTAAVNFAGNPAVAIPIPLQRRHVPLTSVQLIGPRLGEAGLLNAARLIEAAHRDR